MAKTNYSRYQNSGTSRRRVILIVLVVAVVLTLVGGLVWYRHQHANVAYYAPPTKQEQAAGDAAKQQIVEQNKTASQTPAPTAANPGAATVVIADASQYNNPDSSTIVEVRAFVSNVVEKGGTCTITFSKDSRTIVKQVSSNPDATTTQCATLDLDRSTFSATGSWDITVAYSSTDYAGSTKGKVTVE